MSVAIRKVDGVVSVKVSLNEGWADVKLAPGNKVTVGRLRDVVSDNGFTPKDAHIRVKGRLIEREGRFVLEVAGTSIVYALSTSSSDSLAAQAKGAAGKDVLVDGRVPEGTHPDPEPATLEVVSLSWK